METEDNIQRDKPSELERVATKSVDLVLCPHDNCVIIGDYFRCYTNAHRKCQIYLHWIVKDNYKTK